MSACTVVLAFSVGDRVRIVEIDSVGIVYACNISRDGVEFQVRWFNNCDRKEIWLRPEELEAA